ncbi:hypothetical protein E1281_36725 [Actinomadura sp. KC345]|nr:hypothetical protein E1281_36725 [Actinomadura sp. KC345]
MGVELPADLRVMYEVADGDGDDGIFEGRVWLPLEEVVQAHEGHRRRVWFGWNLGWNAVVFDADPPETVRRCTGHPGWIPFAYDYGGNYLAVDMSPARAGRPGQVIAIGRDHEKGPALVAGSVTDLLGDYLDLWTAATTTLVPAIWISRVSGRPGAG